MHITISGRQLDVGDALKEHVTSYIEAAETKYAERPTEARVTFSKNGSAFDCEVSMHLSTGISTVARAEAHDIYSSFKQSYEKLEKQLRRYKRRLKDHH